MAGFGGDSFYVALAVVAVAVSLIERVRSEIRLIAEMQKEPARKTANR